MASDPAAIAKKWSSGMANATTAITDGVNGVTVAPGQAAARNKVGYVNGVQQNQDKWARKVAAVPLESWKQDMINKGVQRIATGAAAAEPKFGQFMTKLLPFIANAKATLPPRGTLDQNIARSTAMIRAMSQFSNS